MSQTRDAILANCRPAWTKVARVIWSAHRDLGLPDDDASHNLVADELGKLVAAGELEGVGNLTDWRTSEVRLPVA